MLSYIISQGHTLTIWYVSGMVIGTILRVLILRKGVFYSMAVKPKNVEEDSWAYTLPHEIGFLIQELAENEAEALQLSKLSTSDFLERTVRQLGELEIGHDTSLSCLIGPRENEIAMDNDPQRPAGADGECRLHVEVLFDDALPGLIGALGRGLADRLDEAVLRIADGKLGIDAEER